MKRRKSAHDDPPTPGESCVQAAEEKDECARDTPPKGSACKADTTERKDKKKKKLKTRKRAKAEPDKVDDGVKGCKRKKGKRKRDESAAKPDDKKGKKRKKRKKGLAELIVDTVGDGETADPVCRGIDDQLDSEAALRHHRDELHVSETKKAAVKILEQCKKELDSCSFVDVTQNPQLAAAKCESFINNMVHSNRMIHHKMDGQQVMHEFAAEPVRRQWEESFLHEPMGNQQACVKFKLGQCIATEMYSHVHGTDFTLREYFTPREMAETAADCANAKQAKKSDCARTTCLLCRRHDVFSAILVARSKGEQVAPSLVLPNMANFVNVKGEYDLSNVVYNLPCRYEGLLDPVATVNLRYFEPFMQNGVRWLRQTVPYSKGLDSVQSASASNHF